MVPFSVYVVVIEWKFLLILRKENGYNEQLTELKRDYFSPFAL